jgi:DTW domain-containing protein YfiP
MQFVTTPEYDRLKKELLEAQQDAEIATLELAALVTRERQAREKLRALLEIQHARMQAFIEAYPH